MAPTRQWLHTETMDPHLYRCGYCSRDIGPNTGYQINHPNKDYRIYICTYCCQPTFVNPVKGNEGQYPGARYGDAVENVPPDLLRLYDEARDCLSVSAYTAAVLLMRKLLMNIGVQEGASGNLHFVEYVGYLEQQHLIPMKAKGWVDHIRKRGNQATHKVPLATEKDAKDLIEFAAVLLKTLYEFPVRVNPPTP